MKTINTLIASSPVFCSWITLQGHQRLNLSIRPGASGGFLIQDPVNSVVSAVFTLQRRLPGDTIARDVQAWSVTQGDGLDGAIEATSDVPEAETVEYRLGTKEGEYYAGGAFVRLGAG